MRDEKVLPKKHTPRRLLRAMQFVLQDGNWRDLRRREYFQVDICTDTRYSIAVIKTFRHRGLKRLFDQGDPSKIRADQMARITDVLAHLDQTLKPDGLNLPGYRLHPLKGAFKGVWSVTISGNWRITFRLEDGDAFDVDLVDYH